MTIAPDTKDWTWVLDRPCPECGFDAATVAPAQVAGALRTTLPTYARALADPGAGRRPDAATWSALEYGCHVRDMCAVFDERVALTLAEDDPLFADWDQDATALAEHYDRQDPAVVARDLQRAAQALAGRLDAVPTPAWERPARRSNGSVFTLGTLAQYLLHDAVHHAWDLDGQRQRPRSAGTQ